MTVQLRFILASLSFLLLSAVVSAADVTPAAKVYKELTPPAAWGSKKQTDKEATKPVLDNVKRIIQGSPLAGSESQFEKYFSLVLFPQWTQTDEKNLNELPKARDMFVKAYLEGSSRNPPAHTLLVDISHRELSKIAQDPEFHPAVRYHAIMIVGLLNETEPNRAGGVRQMPEPYSKSLSTLLEELKKPGNNEAVRVGALLGVTRHLEWDNAKPAGSMTKIQPAIRAEILAELASIVATKAPPMGRSPEGQTWLRRRALEALGHAYALTLDDSFAQLLEGIITDDAEPISLRCTAAEVMSQIDYKAPVVLQIIPAAKRLGYLALYACHTELLRLESLKKKDEELVKITGGVSGGMPGGMGGAGGGGTPGGAGGMTPGGAGGMTPGGAGGTTPGGGGGGMMAGMQGMGKRGKGTSGGKDGMLGGKLADPRAYRIDYSKRRLRTELYSVQLALGKKKRGLAEDPNARGLVSYAKAEPETTAVLNITTQVEAVIREVEAQDQDAATYEKNLRKEMKKLENLTKPLPVAAKTEVAKPAAGPEDELPAAAKAPAEDPAAEIPEAPPAKGAAEPEKAPAEPSKEPAEPAAEAPADEGKALPADKNP